MVSHSRSTWIRLCGVAAIGLLVISSLSGAFAQPRTTLGWQLEHFFGYFAAAMILFAGWPRPFVVTGAMVLIAGLMELLQFFAPNRHPNLEAVVWGTGGAVVAVVLAELFIRAWSRRSSAASKIR